MNLEKSRKVRGNQKDFRTLKREEILEKRWESQERGEFNGEEFEVVFGVQFLYTPIPSLSDSAC